MVRVAQEYYKDLLTGLSFSFDNWSQLLALFSDGSTKLYSTKCKSKELASSCPYVAKAGEAEAACDLVEICHLSQDHLLTEEDKYINDVKKELAIVASSFHSSFDLFGFQKSLIVATAS